MEMLWVLDHVVRPVDVPVTADIDDGNGHHPWPVAEAVRGVLDTSAVGVSREDGPGTGGSPLVTAGDQAGKVAAARSAAEAEGVPVVVNARTDVYWRKVGEEGGRLDEAVRRARVYLQAGADCVFVPGCTSERRSLSWRPGSPRP